MVSDPSWRGRGSGERALVVSVVFAGISVALLRRRARRGARSDARRVEARLSASESSLEEAQRIARMGSFVLDLHTDELTGSDQLRHLLDLDEGARLTGEGVVGVLHPDDRTMMRGLLTGLANDPAPYEVEVRFRDRAGAPHWALARGEGVRDATGQVVRAVGTVQDITERKRLEQQLVRQAFHDPLTGLANRALLYDRAGHALQRAQRSGERLSLLVLDIDDFKLVNDTLGHEAGDRVLVAVADRLRACVRAADTIARMGGDEFAILVEAADETDAVRTANRVLAELERPVSLGGTDIPVQTSIGIADGEHLPGDAGALMRDADLAMYAAKRQGKGRYEIYAPSMRAAVADRVTLEAELRQALVAGQFRLDYQPIIHLDSGTITGFEALLRWDHPVRGTVGPDQFVPALEDTGLIVPVGEWVLREACTQAAAWGARFGRPWTMSINVSPRQLRSPDFVEQVAGALEAGRLEPSLLTVEITEGVMVGDSEATVSKLSELEALHVHTAVDDFGTGYSSLRYLQTLPVDAIKVDRSFTAAVHASTEQAALVRAIVTVAHELHLTVVAEGIESAEQKEHLRGLGCQYGQGFFFAPPEGPGAVEVRLARLAGGGSSSRSGPIS